MPLVINCESLLASQGKANDLWARVKSRFDLGDDAVTVECVSLSEIKKLNRKYRKIGKETNVLTFSYGEGQHDIALCPEVAEVEAKERGVSAQNYYLILLVHALLHVAGLDHEKSGEEATRMSELEKELLQEIGLGGVVL